MILASAPNQRGELELETKSAELEVYRRRPVVHVIRDTHGDPRMRAGGCHLNGRNDLTQIRSARRFVRIQLQGKHVLESACCN